MKQFILISTLALAGAVALPAQQGRGGPPLAWNDKDKDGICDVTGDKVGQNPGQGRRMGPGRGWAASAVGRGRGRGPAWAATGRGRGPGGRGFARMQSNGAANPQDETQPSADGNAGEK